MSVAKDLANRWTDMVLLYDIAFHRSNLRGVRKKCVNLPSQGHFCVSGFTPRGVYPPPNK